jgi:UDP-glucose 4-epimerase
MRIAIIGATGNVGTALLHRLHTAHQVSGIVGIARRVPDETRRPYAYASWLGLDIGAPDARRTLAAALEGCDAVVHLAWAVQPSHREDRLYRTNVTGSANVFAAVAEAGVPQLVYASSLGAYRRGGKDRRVDESWPVGGISSSHYSRHKAQVEQLLDAFEAEHPEVLVTRLRPALIFQAASGSEVGRYMLGPLLPKLLPKLLPGRLLLPVLPLPRELVFQAVHAEDVAEAYWRALERGEPGAFNITAEPVITPQTLARLAGARRLLFFPVSWLRAAVRLSWLLRLQPTDPGWIDLAAQAPLLSSSRAQRELGWVPKHTSTEALAEFWNALAAGRGAGGSPPLEPRRPGSLTAS